MDRIERNKISNAAWDAYMEQRKVENAAEAAWKAAGYQDGPEADAWARAERKASRLLRAHERTVDHIRA